MRSTKLYDVHNICIFMHVPQICYIMWWLVGYRSNSNEAKLSSNETQHDAVGMWWWWWCWQIFYTELNKNNPTERKNERMYVYERKRDPTIKTQYTNDFGYWQIFTVMYASIFLHIVNDWWYITTLRFIVCVCMCVWERVSECTLLPVTVSKRIENI